MDPARPAAGRLYAIGGLVGGQEAHTVEAYDPGSGAWTKRAGMPTARYVLGTTVGPDGRIYAIGGYVYMGGYVGATATVEAYSPGVDAWTTLTGLPGPRESLAESTGADGRIYAIGGTDANNNVVGTVEAYSPASDTWAKRASMPTPRHGLAAVAGPDGRIYAIGGAQYDRAADRPIELTTVEAYTPATDTWVRVASMHEPRYGPAAAVGADGRIYVMGGSATPATALASVEAYDIATNAWAEVAPLQVARELAGAAGIDGHVYVVGGIDTHPGPRGGEGVLSDVEAYAPPCRFLLGFRTLHDQLPAIIGDCTDDEQHNPANGEALQHTAHGLLVRRKSDNRAAFTDGYHTWVDGPNGIQERLNAQRFPWETQSN